MHQMQQSWSQKRWQAEWQTKIWVFVMRASFSIQKEGEDFAAKPLAWIYSRQTNFDWVGRETRTHFVVDTKQTWWPCCFPAGYCPPNHYHCAGHNLLGQKLWRVRFSILESQKKHLVERSVWWKSRSLLLWTQNTGRKRLGVRSGRSGWQTGPSNGI